MDGSIQLSADDRKILLKAYRGRGSADVARRAHVLLLLGAGWSYREIMAGLFASAELVATVKQCFERGGVAAVLRTEPESPEAPPVWSLLPAVWLLTTQPRDFGYYRSRWSCEALALHVILEALRSEVPLAGSFFLFAAASLLGVLSMLPGGLGGFEATLVVLLGRFDVPTSTAVAATLLFRLGTLWRVSLAGLVVLLAWMVIYGRGERALESATD